MKYLIVEDEQFAYEELKRMMTKLRPEYELEKNTKTVIDTIGFLKISSVDLILMDIRLADGSCFEIFNHVEVQTPVIFTTAYDEHAIKAFKLNSIDYLLKPFDEGELASALAKFENIFHKQATPNSLKNFEQLLPVKTKNRFLISKGDNYHYIETENIAHFYSEEGAVFLHTFQNKRHIINYTLDELEQQIDKRLFFRVSRNCIGNVKAIENVSKYFNSRLKLSFIPQCPHEVLVSRVRVPDFLKWMDGIVESLSWASCKIHQVFSLLGCTDSKPCSLLLPFFSSVMVLCWKIKRKNMHLNKFGVRKLISLSLALLGALLSLTGTAQDVSFKTEYIGNSGYYFLPSGDKPREKIDDGKGSAMVYQGKAAIPLSMKVNNDGRPTAWGIGLEGTYTSLHNENFTEEMVSEIVNFQIGMYHVRPLNAKWSMRASAGVGVFTASTDISKIRFRNVLGSVGVIFIRHLKPNLSVGGGLAINSALGYPMLFPAFYVNWKHDGKFNVKAELIDGLDISTSYEFNDYFKLALALEMNGQMALLKKDGEDMIFSHQYIVAGFRPEIQVGKSGLSVSPMIGLNLYRPASYTERTLKGMFASDNDYYFSVSPYAALGLKMKF